MIDVVVVSVEETKSVYYLSPNSLDLKKGDHVIFENESGLFSGVVCKPTYSEKKNNLVLPLKNVLRIVGETDKKTINKNKNLADKAMEDAKKYSKSLDLDMNFVDSYLNFDGSQMFLSFMADDRVDFRELVKKLAQKYKMRIELRQIGVRDKAKKVGGLGPCGLFLCCNSFLTDFDSVSINMAKNQMLALNPTKINGNCGRLLCCLSYEDEEYARCQKGMPSVGQTIKSEFGTGKVVSVDILKRKYKIDVDGVIREIELSDVSCSK